MRAPALGSSVAASWAVHKTQTATICNHRVVVKIMAPFWGALYTRDPKRDNVDNHPIIGCRAGSLGCVSLWSCKDVWYSWDLRSHMFDNSQGNLAQEKAPPTLNFKKVTSNGLVWQLFQ